LAFDRRRKAKLPAAIYAKNSEYPTPAGARLIDYSQTGRIGSSALDSSNEGETSVDTDAAPYEPPAIEEIEGGEGPILTSPGGANSV